MEMEADASRTFKPQPSLGCSARKLKPKYFLPSKGQKSACPLESTFVYEARVEMVTNISIESFIQFLDFERIRHGQKGFTIFFFDLRVTA